MTAAKQECLNRRYEFMIKLIKLFFQVWKKRNDFDANLKNEILDTVNSQTMSIPFSIGFSIFSLDIENLMRNFIISEKVDYYIQFCVFNALSYWQQKNNIIDKITFDDEDEELFEKNEFLFTIFNLIEQEYEKKDINTTTRKRRKF